MRPGYIPIEPFLTVVKSQLPAAGCPKDENMNVFISRRCNLHLDTIEKALGRSQIDFNLADLILCRLGGPLLWHGTKLKKIYETVELRNKEERRLALRQG